MAETRYHIVVACYDSVKRLDKLISSLAQLDKDRFVLHFSVDQSPNQDKVVAALEDLRSVFTIGKLIVRDEHMGLQEHLTECIGLLAALEEGGVLLEDDLFVDKGLIQFLDEYVPLIQDQQDVSSIGLYHQHFFHYSSLPFLPFEEGPYLMQFPCSSGMFIRSDEATELYRFLLDGEYSENAVVVPRNVLKWSNSWKKIYCIYLALNSKFVLYPQRSVVTNTGEAGTHIKISSQFYQSPLGHVAGMSNLRNPSNIVNRYDVFMEPLSALIKKVQPELNRYEFDVDLEGDRSFKYMRKRYLISSKPCSKPLMQFGDELRPLIHNLKYPRKHGPISFGLTKDFANSKDKMHIKRFESILPPLSSRLLFKMFWRSLFK